MIKNGRVVKWRLFLLNIGIIKPNIWARMGKRLYGSYRAYYEKLARV